MMNYGNVSVNYFYYFSMDFSRQIFGNVYLLIKIKKNLVCQIKIFLSTIF